MSHEDERRSAAEIDALLAAEAADDLLAFARSQGQLRREVTSLRARLLDAAEERAQQSVEQRRVSEELREVERRAAELRRETRTLRADIERVRGSRTFRVGRAVLHPTSLLRGTPSSRSTPHEPPPASPPEVAAPAPEQSRESVERPATAVPDLDPTALIPPRAEGAVFPPESDRVLFCADASPVGVSGRGVSRVHRLVEDLRHRGADVRVLARPGFPWDTTAAASASPATRAEHLIDDVPYVHRPCPGLEDLSWERGVLAVADAVTREALRTRPATIHAISAPQVAFPALIAARRVGVPFVLDTDGQAGTDTGSARPSNVAGAPSAPPELGALIAREADAVIAAAPEIEAALAAQGVDRARIAAPPFALDGRYHAPLPKDPEQSASCGIRTDVPVIGALGWSSGEVDPSSLLSASAELAARGLDHQLVLVGPLPETSLDGLPTDGRVVHLSEDLSLENLPLLLSMVDVAVLPMQELRLPQAEEPTLALECMSSMTAMLLPDVAQYRSLSGPSLERAALYAPGETESLAEALADLLDSPELRRSLGRAARLWALDAHPWDAAVEAVHDVHRSLGERSRHRSAPSPRTAASLRVGLIADEFTTTTLSASLTIVPLQRDGWRSQLAKGSLDLVLVESAWGGNGGQWHRGVGAYEPAEHQDIRDLLAAARERGIPTAFWNKEDPVHFRRFRETAALCDHVFTTDADMIPHYLRTTGAVTRTASSMPFFAQPALHNPLPTDRPYRHTVAYAGTYYGDRYPERSAALYMMLATAARTGLTIYDRQAGNPESPYRFPADLDHANEGALPYDEVIDSYKTHLAHLNANSVDDSPTMFSRRVVEIAASGGVALSGPGRGVEETFGGLIPVSSDPALWRLLLQAWAEDPVARVREAWRQMRAVHRAHTIDTALTVMLRTIGIPVDSRPAEDYALVLPDPSESLVESVVAQSWRPQEVLVPGGPSDLTAPLQRAGIRVRATADGIPQDSAWVGVLENPVPRTWFEDILLAPRFGNWSRIDVEIADRATQGRTLASYGSTPGSTSGLVRADRASAFPSVAEALRSTTEDSVRLLLAPPQGPDRGPADVAAVASPPATVLIAGHDLKFAAPLITALRASGHTVLVDRWTSHALHDERRSRELLAMADVVFCEWGLGNAVWYSRHVEDHQRLVVRVHLQELDRPFLRRIRHARVDRYIFVGELVRRAAVDFHGVPAHRSTVIPNSVDVESLALPKDDDAAFHLGFIGMVPRRKRLDLAVDLLERLLQEDSRYRLFVKGRTPEDHAWMAKRPDELAYYDDLRARIEALVAEHPGAVTFDPHGDDVPQWFQKIGIAVSVSDTESFHFTLADGAASGALPAALAWPGADCVYPREWLSPTIEEMAASILTRQQQPRTESRTVRNDFAQTVVLPRLLRAILEERR